MNKKKEFINSTNIIKADEELIQNTMEKINNKKQPTKIMIYLKKIIASILSVLAIGGVCFAGYNVINEHLIPKFISTEEYNTMKKEACFEVSKGDITIATNEYIITDTCAVINGNIKFNEPVSQNTIKLINLFSNSTLFNADYEIKKEDDYNFEFMIVLYEKTGQKISKIKNLYGIDVYFDIALDDDKGTCYYLNELKLNYYKDNRGTHNIGDEDFYLEGLDGWRTGYEPTLDEIDKNNIQEAELKKVDDDNEIEVVEEQDNNEYCDVPNISIDIDANGKNTTSCEVKEISIKQKELEKKDATTVQVDEIKQCDFFTVIKLEAKTKYNITKSTKLNETLSEVSQEQDYIKILTSENKAYIDENTLKFNIKDENNKKVEIINYSQDWKFNEENQEAEYDIILVIKNTEANEYDIEFEGLETNNEEGTGFYVKIK